jgi:hypothetical protein
MTEPSALLHAFQRDMYAADVVNDDKWRAFIRHACLLLPLIRSGAIDGFQALEVCKDVCRRYFEIDDPQTKFSCQRVLIVIKRVAESIGPIPKRKVLGGSHHQSHEAEL